MCSSWTNPARSWSWSRRRGGLIVRASFSALNDVDPVSQVFKEPLKGATRGYYRITGSWDDPQLKQIEAQELKDDRQASSPQAALPAAEPPAAQEPP
jgi:hypothetical protein